eukprot:TRINITY_DN103_c1_g2_i1.p1 TRINITY_DN103_c1_g2~~TRINITY_DN103_c1_g2_i1.p1  ORF type:complete len:177 (+),score=27.02 TRINITY_DN103_c1_g2_i1:46-576(+)
MALMSMLPTSEDYIAVVVAMPVYWFLVMVPAFIRAHRILNPSKDSAPSNEEGGGSEIEAPSAIKVNVDPRNAAAKIMEDENHPDAAFIRRLQGAHDNGWEGFILFLSAVTAAWLAQIDPHYMNAFSIASLVSRFFYNIAYMLADSPKLSFIRSFFFACGFVSIIALYVKAIYDILD